eukprot:5975792-Pyramimonas_sp.AAC.1
MENANVAAGSRRRRCLGLPRRPCPRSKAEVDLLLSEVISGTNRSFHRGGYGPCQLAFGENPRPPRCTLSDDAAGEVGVDDLRQSAIDLDAAAAAFARAHQL